MKSLKNAGLVMQDSNGRLSKGRIPCQFLTDPFFFFHSFRSVGAACAELLLWEGFTHLNHR